MHTWIEESFQEQKQGSWVRLVTKGAPLVATESSTQEKHTGGRGAEVMMGVWETGTWQIEGGGGEKVSQGESKEGKWLWTEGQFTERKKVLWAVVSA